MMSPTEELTLAAAYIKREYPAWDHTSLVVTEHIMHCCAGKSTFAREFVARSRGIYLDGHPDAVFLGTEWRGGAKRGKLAIVIDIDEATKNMGMYDMFKRSRREIIAMDEPNWDDHNKALLVVVNAYLQSINDVVEAIEGVDYVHVHLLVHYQMYPGNHTYAYCLPYEVALSAALTRTLDGKAYLTEDEQTTMTILETNIREANATTDLEEMYASHSAIQHAIYRHMKEVEIYEESIRKD